MSDDESRESNLPQLVFSYRRVLVVLVHLALWAGAFVGAFLLRFDARVPPMLWPLIRIWLPVSLGIRTAVYFYFRIRVADPAEEARIGEGALEGVILAPESLGERVA